MAQQEQTFVNVPELLLTLVKSKRFLILNTLIISIIAVVVTLLMPKYYVATSVLMPPESEKAELSSLMRGLPFKDLLGGAGGSLGGNNLADVYIAISNSRSLRMKLVDSFNLAHVYKFDKAPKYFTEDVLKELARHISTSVSDLGTIEITAGDTDPKRAKEMADCMVSQLDEIYKSLKLQNARNKRIFLEERISVVKHDLTAAEDSLVSFQRKNGAVNLEEQARATIDVASGIEAEYMAADLKLKLQKDLFSSDNAGTRELTRRMAALSAQREKLSNSRLSQFLIPLTQAPLLGLQFFRLKRDAKIQELLYEYLVQQYEEVKFDEARTTPTVQILDKAEIPQKRAKPKRGKICIMAFMVSIIEGMALVLLVQRFKEWQRSNSPSYITLAQAWSIAIGRKKG